MKRLRLTGAMVASALFVSALGSNVAQASEIPAAEPTIAIIDSGYDPASSFVAANVVHEVCVLSFNVCPNGKNLMEGPGSAAVPAIAIARNTDFYHGTEMASIVLSEHPAAKLIMIRVVANTSTGAKASTNPLVIGRALAWVYENAAKFNIVAVNTSMGIAQKGGTCNSDTTFDTAANGLVAKQIPMFFPTGNGRNYKSVDWPACDSRAISVGGLDFISKTFNPALYSNFGPSVEYFALGKRLAMNKSGTWTLQVGTSVASAAVAGKYMKLRSQNPAWTYSDTVAKLDSQVFPAWSTVKNGRFEVRALDLRAF